MRYHVTGLHGIREDRLQHALDLRLHGALIHFYDASPMTSKRQRKRVRIGRLAIPRGMVSSKAAFKEALDEPGKKCKLFVGPYDLVITVYKEFVSREQKLKNENEELRGRLEKLEQALEDMQQRKKESDALLGHVLDSKTPVDVKAAGSSRNPRGSGERRPSIKRRPEKRSPVHKRVKMPVRTEAAQIQEKSLPSTFEEAMKAQVKKKAEEERKMALMDRRLSGFLRDMYDHG